MSNLFDQAGQDYNRSYLLRWENCGTAPSESGAQLPVARVVARELTSSGFGRGPTSDAKVAIPLTPPMPYEDAKKAFIALTRWFGRRGVIDKGEFVFRPVPRLVRNQNPTGVRNG